MGEYLGIVHRAEVSEDQTDTEQESEVTDPVDQEGLEVGIDGGRSGVPETDQQVGHQTDRFPAEKQLQEIVAHHQHEHGKCEQRDVTEKALVAGILGHVSDGVDMHHQGHKGDHQHHRDGEPVDQEADVEFNPVDHAPCVERAVEQGARRIERLLRHHERPDKGDQHTENGHAVRRAAPDQGAENACAKHAGDQRARKRRQRHQQQQALKAHFPVIPSASRVHRR